MPSLELIRGPALDDVADDDAAGLADLAREQRARLATIREDGCWQWLGDTLGGPRRMWQLYGMFAFLGLVPLTLLVAGFTQGPVLWVTAALCALAPLPYWLAWLPARRRERRFYRTAELRPAFVVAADPELADPANEELGRAHVLLGPPLGDPAALRALADAAARLTGFLRGETAAPDELQPFVAELRQRVDAGRADGTRLPAPAALGPGYEVAHLRLSPWYLPDDHLTSRLVFVLVAPRSTAGRSASGVPSLAWGNGTGTLCDAFPWPTAPEVAP